MRPGNPESSAHRTRQHVRLRQSGERHAAHSLDAGSWEASDLRCHSQRTELQGVRGTVPEGTVGWFPIWLGRQWRAGCDGVFCRNPSRSGPGAERWPQYDIPRRLPGPHWHLSSHPTGFEPSLSVGDSHGIFRAFGRKFASTRMAGFDSHRVFDSGQRLLAAAEGPADQSNESSVSKSIQPSAFLSLASGRGTDQ